MKHMRLTALLLALVLMLSLASTAVAEEPREKIVIGLVLNTNVEDYDTNAYTLFLEEQMNVDIEFFLFQDMAQKLPVMIASNSQLPDMILGTFDSASLVNWTAQGVFLPLTKYWNDPAMTPNFDKRLADLGEGEAKKKEILGNVTMPDGEIYTLPSYDENIWNLRCYRACVNMDWLAALNMEMPTTTEEFTTMLRRFAAEDPNGNGLKDEIPMIGSTAWGANPIVFLLNSFIHANPDSIYLNVEGGKVVPAYTQDAFKKGLEYIKGLYDEGLIQAQSFTQDQAQMKAALNDDVALCGVATMGSMSNLTTDARLNSYRIMPPLTGPDGVRFAASVAGGSTGRVYITSYAKNPELCFKLAENNYDYGWRMRARQGVEGENWTFDPEVVSKWIGQFEPLGYKPTYVVLNNVWGKMQNVNWGAELMPFLTTERAILTGSGVKERTPENEAYVDPFVYHYQGYSDCGPAEMIGNLVFTEAETEVRAAIEPTIKEYVEEMMVAFVTGNASFDEWNGYLAELNAMGLEDYIAVNQAAFDRK